jgi:hypothetical protein
MLSSVLATLFQALLKAVKGHSQIPYKANRIQFVKLLLCQPFMFFAVQISLIAYPLPQALRVVLIFSNARVTKSLLVRLDLLVPFVPICDWFAQIPEKAHGIQKVEPLVIQLLGG